MGYRSNGAFALRKQSYEQAKILDIKLPEILEGMTFVDHSDDWVYWEYDSYKMYDGYADVDELTAFIDQLETDDWGDKVLWAKGPSCSYKGDQHFYEPMECFSYVRIGESSDDTEERGYSDFLSVSRDIHIGE